MCGVYALDKVLLIRALRVDRGSGRVLSLLAAHGERSTGEGYTEGGHCELETQLVSLCPSYPPNKSHPPQLRLSSPRIAGQMRARHALHTRCPGPAHPPKFFGETCRKGKNIRRAIRPDGP